MKMNIHMYMCKTSMKSSGLYHLVPYLFLLTYHNQCLVLQMLFSAALHDGCVKL